jgi:squalene-hopene/tetraprenyl-beta-curcumene cyclase
VFVGTWDLIAGESEALARAAESTLATLQLRLLAQFKPGRPWTGHLSGSAIATAVAVFALSRVDARTYQPVIQRGLDWLAASRNPEGGWGDSPESPSNLTATLLTWFAATGCPVPDDADPDVARRRADLLSGCESWLSQHLGDLTPEALAAGVIARYGGDRTFAAPILTMAALAGCLGPVEAAWKKVPQLPFELAALPHAWFGVLNLTVVSYALPALIAVGLVRHHHHPSRCHPLRALRDRLKERLLRIALRMQPSNGGYEEATPLTAFVTMSLAAAGEGDHEIVRRGVSFIMASQRPDGCWPIDSDLATWVTVQSVMALSADRARPLLTAGQCSAIRDWLLAQQHTAEHPLTFGAPGGWGWTDLPGSMPDADDTSGVLLALHHLGAPDARVRQAVGQGLHWLLNVQNRDGGIPTFARGWGRLPFDRSCPDISAHTLHAFLVWGPHMPPPLQAQLKKGVRRLLRYLTRSQTSAGSWIPLWFGTQCVPDESNPTYGTARTVAALHQAQRLGFPGVGPMLNRACDYLATSQHADGGWGAQPGAPASIEETSVALAALAGTASPDVLQRGVSWLVEATREGKHTPASPIGLYFARLWYAESLYPVIFAVGALAQVRACPMPPPGKR